MVPVAKPTGWKDNFLKNIFLFFPFSSKNYLSLKVFCELKDIQQPQISLFIQITFLKLKELQAKHFRLEYFFTFTPDNYVLSLSIYIVEVLDSNSLNFLGRYG